jgi:endonuclease YncB( thermonuclease family)
MFKNILFTFIISICSISLLHAEDKNLTTYGNLTAAVVDVYDGDTIAVSIEGIPPIFGDRILVRIYGVDTPEIKGKCEREKQLAQKAKQFVQEKLPIGSIIVLRDVGRDKYFRINASITLYDGNDLRHELINNNLAYPYFGETKKSWCGDVIPMTELFK